MDQEGESRRYRSIWISDIHLGTRGCKADFLLDFLRHNESEYLYLVGDIIDWWELRKTWYFWAQNHNDIVQKVLRKARKGAKVIFVPGNHDEILRNYVGMHLGGVSIEKDAVHTLADGRRFLVIHGDEFDGVIKFSRQLAMLGSWAYDVALVVNDWYNLARRRLGYPYWSLSAYLKRRVKNAVEYITKYEEAMAHEAKKRGADGVICGHIHNPEIRLVDGILYCNDGDWVESCTALVEDFEGRLELIHWAKTRAEAPAEVLA